MSVEEVILNSPLFAGFGKSNGDYKSHSTTPNVSPHSKQAVRNAKAAAIAKVVPPASPVKEVALMKVIH